MSQLEAFCRAHEREEKIKDAANQILRISSELHLTWAEFEETVKEIKKKAVLETKTQS